MKAVSIFLALSVAAVAQAQDQCAAVAAKVPECAVSWHADSASFQFQADSDPSGVMYRVCCLCRWLR